jgi:Zn-dependent peptidase ImmA (M78 family)
MASQRKRISSLAAKVLADNNITKPPIPVERLARKLGARVVMQSLDDGVSGFVYRDKSQPTIGVNTFHSRVRQRFTIAHELGHLLLEDTEGVHIDSGDFLMKFRDEESSKGTKDDERDANQFAAELLLPKAFLERDLSQLNDFSVTDDSQLRALAKRYEVSLQALLIRLSSLRFLSKA